MKSSKKRKKIEKRLRIVRMSAYIGISFLIFEYIGLFAIAGPAGIYKITDHRSNAFYPKTFVDVKLKEPNGQEYVLDADGNAKNENNQNKQVFVKNPGVNKKDVVVRARIIATIYDEDGVTAIDHPQNFKITGEALTANPAEAGKWYHEDTVDHTLTYGTANAESYFYYTNVLQKGTSTSNLFDNVQLTDVSQVPDGGFVEFKVMVDTIEVDTEQELWDTRFAKAKTAWGTIPANIWR